MARSSVATATTARPECAPRTERTCNSEDKVKRIAVTMVLIAATLAGGADVRAQVPWESPQLIMPSGPRGASLMFVDYGLSPLQGTGLLAMYRRAAVPAGVGLRVAATLPDRDRVRISGGIDIAVPMFQSSATFPLDVIWTSGIGGGYGDYFSVALPVGVAAGRVLGGNSVGFSPYTAARLVMEGYFGPDHPDETFALTMAADLGAELWLRRSQGVRLRGALSLGDRRALAIGLHIAPGNAPPVAARQR
jgi:hypothetical protein